MPAAVNPLPSLIRASSWDAGNAAMRAAGRTKWTEDDWNEAAATQDRLIDACYGKGPEGRIKFQIAEQLQRAGYLTISMKGKEFFATVEAAWQQINEQVAA